MSNYPDFPKDPSPQLLKVWDALLAHGSTFGGGQDWTCVAHSDDRASLGVTAGAKVPVLLKCQSGCTTTQIVAALELKWSDVMGDVKKPKAKVVSRTKWAYTALDGTPTIDVYRFDLDDGSKRYAQCPAGYKFQRGVKSPGVDGIEDTPYRCVEFVSDYMHQVSRTLWVVEGEKSADFLADIGENATTQRMGADQPWPESFTALFVDAQRYGSPEVKVVADYDAPGFRRALAVARALHKAGVPVSVVHSATLGKGDDVVDHLAAGRGLATLVKVSASEIKAQLELWDAEKNGDPNATSVNLDLWPTPSAPYEVANRWVDEFHAHATGETLAFWRDGFYEWREARNRYYEIETPDLRNRIYRKLNGSYYPGATEPKLWSPNAARVSQVIDALQARVHLSSDVERSYKDGSSAERTIAFANGNYAISSKSLSEPTAGFFTDVALPRAYDPGAAKPERWLRFLSELWPDDEQSRLVLQEWFGYVLSGDLSLQKIFVLYGAPRSGKSTIASVLTALVGVENCCAPSPGSLTSDHGLESWLGKSLATMPDVDFMKLARNEQAKVAEVLKAVSGEDSVTVNPKFKKTRSLVLPTRIMITSNFMPTLLDASGALPMRYVSVNTVQSFANAPDVRLRPALLEELAGITRWALQGYERLISQGRFTEPESQKWARLEMLESASPVTEFVRDRCLVDSEAMVSKGNLFSAYRDWAEDSGDHPMTHNRFSRELKSGFPKISSVQRERQWQWEGIKVRSKSVKLRAHSVKVTKNE